MTKARIHSVIPDTGAGMATVIFSLFSNAHYFDSVICQKKVIYASNDLLTQFLWLDVQFLHFCISV